MAKQYCVTVDITMSKNFYVDAESEEHAKEIVDGMIDSNPYAHTNNFSHFVGYEIVEAMEED